LPQGKSIPRFTNKEEGFKLQKIIFQVTGLSVPQLSLNVFTGYQE